MNNKQTLSNESNLENSLQLRQYTQADMPFMFQLYCSTREPEMAMTNFTQQEKHLFLKQQFQFQSTHYFNHYCTDFFNIVLINNEPAGRFFVDYWNQEIRIVDIALMPNQRNKGVGSVLMTRLFEEAKKRALPVTINVERNNPAKNLYSRLGFNFKSDTNEVYQLMEWLPNQPIPAITHREEYA